MCSGRSGAWSKAIPMFVVGFFYKLWFVGRIGKLGLLRCEISKGEGLTIIHNFLQVSANEMLLYKNKTTIQTYINSHDPNG